MSLRLLFIRHGAIVKPHGSLLGDLDLTLSCHGKIQMVHVAAGFKDIAHEIIAFGASNLERSVNSCQIIQQILAPHIAIHIDPRLREISLGVLDGLTKGEIQARWPKTYLMRGLQLDLLVPDGGESFRMLKRRVFFALQDLLLRYKDAKGIICLVSHAGVMRVVLAHFMALAIKDVFSLPIPYGASFVLPAKFM